MYRSIFAFPIHASMAALLIVALCSQTLSADFKAGVAAYKRGDFEAALRAWRPLAEQGNPNAQFNLGLMYNNGKGVPKDDVEAMKWYRMAAEQGYANAQFNLGFMYDSGQGVPEDDVEAVKWYRMAAEQGHAKAQNNMGVMHKIGEGVPQDDDEAMKWYRMAAEQGHARARETLEREFNSLQRAIRLYSGMAGKVDESGAQRLFEQAARTGNALGVMWLARGYLSG